MITEYSQCYLMAEEGIELTPFLSFKLNPVVELAYNFSFFQNYSVFSVYSFLPGYSGSLKCLSEYKECVYLKLKKLDLKKCFLSFLNGPCYGIQESS